MISGRELSLISDGGDATDNIGPQWSPSPAQSDCTGYRSPKQPIHRFANLVIMQIATSCTPDVYRDSNQRKKGSEGGRPPFDPFFTNSAKLLTEASIGSGVTQRK
jgi:hypothetical protein